MRAMSAGGSGVSLARRRERIQRQSLDYVGGVRFPEFIRRRNRRLDPLAPTHPPCRCRDAELEQDIRRGSLMS
jgi:hypothetical protein